MTASKKSAQNFSVVPMDVGPLPPDDPTGLFTPASDKREQKKLGGKNLSFSHKSYSAAKHDKHLALLLQYLCHGCSLNAIIRQLGITWAVVKHATVARPDFAEALEEAKNLSVTAKVLYCEEELERRAFIGTSKQCYDKDGYLIRTEVTQNDKLLEKVLQVNDPEKFAPAAKASSFSLGNNNLVLGGPDLSETLAEILLRNRKEPLSPPTKEALIDIETESLGDK